MSEIASAFVRIRPNMAGFEQEAQTGVTSAFSKLGKAAGIAFSAALVIDFGKHIVEHAADIQKQIEAVRTEFGAASKEIFDFGDKSAAALGISSHLADATAARFGILFKNLGIGPELAAKMTVNFEKLGGSISQIRNIDPASVFQSLPLAVAGNLRSLKQLGIAVDQNSLKIAAYKLGLTQTVSQGLTPAQRAIAIYALATAHLGEFQQQAGAHADDLANRMRKLKAEFHNQTDELGAKLLPALSAVAAFLLAHLPAAAAATKKAFQDVGTVVHDLVAPIGGLKNAVILLLNAFVVAKIVAFASAIRTNLIAGGVKILAKEFQVAEAEVIAAYGGMELATIGLSATIKSALITTGFGALIVVAGLAAEYVITHWSQVKRWFGEFAAYLHTALNVAWAAIRETAKATAYGILEYFTFAIRGILEAASHLPFIGKYARRALDAIQGALDAFKPDFSKVSDAFGAGGRQAGDAFADGMRKQIKAQVGTFGGTLPALSALLGKQVNDAVSQAVVAKPKTDKQIAAAALRDAAANQAAILKGLQQNYDNAAVAQDATVAKIREKIRVLGQSLVDAVQQENRDLRAAVESAKSNLTSIGQTLASTIGQVLDKPIQDAQNKISALQNRQSLENLRASVLLPGGKQLSKDPKQALAELQALASQAGNVNKAAIQAFITQYRSATLTVQQDQVNRIKETATQRISDLTDAFNRGQITLVQYKKRVLALLTADHVSYKTAGALLGTAFANGFRQSVGDLFKQAGAISVAPSFKGLTGSNANIVAPLESIRADQKQVATIQRQIRDQHGALQTRIDKNTAAAAQLLAKIHAVQLGATSRSLVKNPGDAQKRTAALNGTTH